MKHTIKRIFAGLLLIGAVSCTANYDDVNTHPYQPGDLDAFGKGLGVAMNAMAGCVVSPDVNTAQFTDCLLGGPMGGYFADANAGWANTISNYNPKDDWSRPFMKSDKIIPTLYTNFRKIQGLTNASGDQIPMAVATIIKVAAMHRVVDTYGPIPYTRIGEDGSILVPYDAVDKVYERFFEELDSSIEILTANQTALFAPTADYIYGGNVKKWIQYANSLKLRLAIRIAYADRETAKKKAEEAIANEVGVITRNEDNASWNYFKTTNNPIYTAVNYNKLGNHPSGSTCITGGDSHAAADIICYMNGYNDPRREKFFTKSEWAGVDYVGMRRGIIIPDMATVGHQYSGINISSTTPLFWMNAAEVAFLRAEGVAIFGFEMGGSAEGFYNEGIRLSFDQWKVEGVDNYLSDATLLPATYADPAGSNNHASPLSTITIKWDAAATPDQMQERIIIQKWIANWMLGNESWADIRRTGFPKLIPASIAGNKSNGGVDSSRGARRMPYPLDEYVSNSDNIAKAVSEHLGGADNMSTDLWWARKNN